MLAHSYRIQSISASIDLFYNCLPALYELGRDFVYSCARLQSGYTLALIQALCIHNSDIVQAYDLSMDCSIVLPWIQSTRRFISCLHGLDLVQTQSKLSLDLVQTQSGLCLDLLQTQSRLSLDVVLTYSIFNLDLFQTFSSLLYKSIIDLVQTWGRGEDIVQTQSTHSQATAQILFPAANILLAPTVLLILCGAISIDGVLTQSSLGLDFGQSVHIASPRLDTICTRVES